MFERFTNQARRTVVLAQQEASLHYHDYIGTEHLLLGLLHGGQGTGARALASAGITLEAARAETVSLVGRGTKAPSGHIPFTRRAKKSLEFSLREALDLEHSYIGTGHILLGLTRQGDGKAVEILGRLDVDLDHLREQTVSELRRQPEEQDDSDRTDRLLPPPDNPLSHLQDEVARLRALLRKHGINPDEPADPPADAG